MQKIRKIWIPVLAVLCILTLLVNVFSFTVLFTFEEEDLYFMPLLFFFYAYEGYRTVSKPIYDRTMPYDIEWMVGKSEEEVKERYGVFDYEVIPKEGPHHPGSRFRYNYMGGYGVSFGISEGKVVYAEACWDFSETINYTYHSVTD